MAAEMQLETLMRTQPTRIIFATDQPLLVIGYRDVLFTAGFCAEPAMLQPKAAAAWLRREDPCLVLLDSRYEVTPASLVQAVHESPLSRMILVGAEIKPEAMIFAVQAGLHGVLSTRLPVEEAASTIKRIWQGERLFRFDCAEPRANAAPIGGIEDFDEAWMFGQAL
jgi:DNA-binding NarL/FixJ family response regulator